MATTARRTLQEYLDMRYPFTATVLEDGSYFIEFPDLPGCWSGAERIEDVPAMAEEARRLWIQTTYENGMEVPPPSVRKVA